MKASLQLACGISGLIYFSTMAVNTNGAENPCVKNWQWQWKVLPTLAITGPTDVPLQCVGQITVGPATVTATAGVKWEVDINNCPEPPHTRNETSVPISPVNTWSLYLYPAGTTPTSGSGTTATFTTINGGGVVVQFETRATVSGNPPWDSGLLAHRTNPFNVVGPRILEPNLDPVTDDNFTFDAIADPNGTCTVTAIGTSGVASEDPNLEWSLTPMTGSTLTSSPSPPKGADITFWYTRLPAANAYFGQKTLTVRHPAGCQDSITVYIFFRRDEANHPGTGSGTKPNWVYYWRQTTASFPTYEPTYDPNLSQPGVTRYVSGAWYTYIGPPARLSGQPLDGPQRTSTFDGIDYYAYTWRHEARHANILNSWFPNGPGGPDIYPDLDDDDLPDSLEPTFTAQEGGPFDPSRWDTDGDGLNDGHDYVYFTQTGWTIGSADGQDWANPGHQSNR